MKKYIEIRIGGGQKAQDGKFWANILIIGEKKNLYSNKPHENQLDTVFSRNKPLLLQKAQEEASSLAHLYGIETIEVLDQTEDPDEQTKTLTVESNHRGAI